MDGLIHSLNSNIVDKEHYIVGNVNQNDIRKILDPKSYANKRPRNKMLVVLALFYTQAKRLYFGTRAGLTSNYCCRRA